MPNKKLFKSTPGAVIPPTNTQNAAGGNAYKLSDKAALAQLIATGTFNDTFYQSGAEQLKVYLELLNKLKNAGEIEYIAKVAVYGRTDAYMKDTPAFVLAYLFSCGDEGRKYGKQIADKILDNGRMLRNFVQFIRSGVFGRKSLGSAAKNIVKRYLETKPVDKLFKDSVGNDPSLADIIKMVHPKPDSEERAALFRYICDVKQREGDGMFDASNSKLPDTVLKYEMFKNGETTDIPKVPFQMLTGLNSLSPDVWKTIARNGQWQQTRMNLNTYKRHGVLDDATIVKDLAAKLGDKAEVQKSMCFPYQLLIAYLNTKGNIPEELSEALQDAMDHAVENVPTFNKKVAIFVDCSGSMMGPVTGNRGGGTSKASCLDAAATFAAVMLKKNPGSRIIPFGTTAWDGFAPNRRDSIMTLATDLAKAGNITGYGTNISSGIELLNHKNLHDFDLLVWLSDMQSWIDSKGLNRFQGTETMQQFREYQRHVPHAKAVYFNLQPYGDTQAVETVGEVMNIGGFSDQMFKTVSDFANDVDPNTWVQDIEKIDLA